jgi:hypothetical protein
MNRYTHEVPMLTICSGDNFRARVSLACPPDGVTFDADRSATDPRTAPIRGDQDWRRDPVLRHADTRKDRG